jgi:hypothetical protein
MYQEFYVALIDEIDSIWAWKLQPNAEEKRQSWLMLFTSLLPISWGEKYIRPWDHCLSFQKIFTKKEKNTLL